MKRNYINELTNDDQKIVAIKALNTFTDVVLDNLYLLLCRPTVASMTLDAFSEAIFAALRQKLSKE